MTEMGSSFSESEKIVGNFSNYKELQGKNQFVEGEKWTTEWMLSEYLKNTDELIGKIDGTIPLKGVNVYVPDSVKIVKKEERDLPRPDSVIYLDKSARPVEWMVRSLWPELAREPGTDYRDGVVPQMPKEFFLNLDKRDWLSRMGVEPQYIEDAPSELIDISRIDRDHLARIRAIFCKDAANLEESEVSKAWELPTIFDGQQIMIIDEVASSGKTLSIAQMLLSSAIPEATFSGEYWLKPIRLPLNNGATYKDADAQFRVQWVPIWYSQSTSSGRGISNRDPRWPEIVESQGRTPHPLTKLGRYILSTPSHDPETNEPLIDKKAINLRNDFKQMAIDVASHKILYRPSPRREDDDVYNRITAINDVSSMREWRDRRDALEPKSTHRR